MGDSRTSILQLSQWQDNSSGEDNREARDTVGDDFEHGQLLQGEVFPSVVLRCIVYSV